MEKTTENILKKLEAMKIDFNMIGSMSNNTVVDMDAVSYALDDLFAYAKTCINNKTTSKSVSINDIADVLIDRCPEIAQQGKVKGLFIGDIPVVLVSMPYGNKSVQLLKQLDEFFFTRSDLHTYTSYGYMKMHDLDFRACEALRYYTKPTTQIDDVATVVYIDPNKVIQSEYGRYYININETMLVAKKRFENEVNEFFIRRIGGAE